MKTNTPKNKRPRGRPVTFDRDKVLDAAVTVFWQMGYDGASIDALTDAMGINRPSMYSAFGNKRALFDAAIDRYAATRGHSEFDALHHSDDPKTAISDFFEISINNSIEFGKPRGCMIANVATDAAESDEPLRKKLSEMFTQTDDGIATRFRADQQSGRLPSNLDPDALARMVHSVVHSIKVRARAGADRTELNQITKTFVHLFFPSTN